LALLSNGQILAFSASSLVQGVTRYNSNGSVDHTFGSLGEAASTNTPATLAIQTNGSILAAGMNITGVAMPTVFTGNPTGVASCGSFRGATDTTFGPKGGVITAFPGRNLGGTATVAVETNGDIVAAGNPGFASSNQSQFTCGVALARYLSGGQLTPHSATEAGFVSTSFGTTNVAFIAAMAIHNDGKIVVAGETGDAAAHIVVARYLAQ
jgi:hypothetical protein